ncbi:MFS transporter [Kordiimonas sp.]|uniref:MFS transporter n=1 Tax=Kordiimonas sp. TaxID=1970157 RepID=UPI003A8D47F4
MPILFLVIFVIMASFALLLPSIMFVLQNLGASEAWATPILASYGFAQFLSGPVWGRLSDRVGRKPVLVASLLLAALSYCFVAFGANTVVKLHLGLVFAGLCAGNSAVLYAAVTDLTGIEGRAKGMGVIGAGIGLAFTVGPAIGAMLSGVSADGADISSPAKVSVVACLLGALVVALRFHESLSVPEGAIKSGHVGRIEAVRRLGYKPLLLQLSIVMCFFTFGLAMMESIMSYLMNDKHNWGPRDLGVMFAYFGLVLIIVQGGLVGRLAARFGEVNLARSGIIFMGIGLGSIAFSPVSAGVFVGLTFVSVGTAIFNTSVLSIASRASEAGERGLVMGVFQSMQALGRSIGPILTGFLYGYFHELPFVVSIGIMMLLLVWASLLFSQMKRQAAT